MIDALARLSDDEVLSSLDMLVARGAQWLTRLLGYLGEVDERRLHLREGYSSMFSFCTRKLRMSEGEACRRIAAARLARKHPRLIDLISRGDIHLCAILVIYPHVKKGNFLDLIDAAVGKTKRQVEAIVAARFPKADAPQLIRKLPTSQSTELFPAAQAVLPAVAPSPRGAPSLVPLAQPPTASPIAVLTQPTLTALAPAPTPTTHNPISTSATSSTTASVAARPQQHVAPLSAGRFKVQFTAGAKLREKIEHTPLRLMSHRNPTRDIAYRISTVLAPPNACGRTESSTRTVPPRSQDCSAHAQRA